MLPRNMGGNDQRITLGTSCNTIKASTWLLTLHRVKRRLQILQDLNVFTMYTSNPTSLSSHFTSHSLHTTISSSTELLKLDVFKTLFSLLNLNNLNNKNPDYNRKKADNKKKGSSITVTHVIRTKWEIFNTGLN